MSRHHDELLRRLCQNDDTFSRAKAILHTASIKTAQGSGYELGQGAIGLPAICAYIAGEELGDDEVDEKTAQGASCLKPRVFKTTLNTVRTALAAAAATTSPKKSTASARGLLSYRMLVDEKRIGRKGMVTEWMNGAERTLMANVEMRRKFGQGGGYDMITIAVFCWTLQIMERKNDVASLLEKHKVARDLFDELMDALHDVCGDVANTIRADIAALKAGTSAAKATRDSNAAASVYVASSNPTPPSLTKNPTPLPLPTPSRALTRSPSKSALRAPSVGSTPTKTPNNKRKVAFDEPIPEEDEEEFDALATPSKRQKLSFPLKSLTSTPTTTPRARGLASVREEGEGDDELLLLPMNVQPAIAGPSTPRRPRGTPSQPSSAHSARSVRTPRSRSHSQAGSVPTTPRRRGAMTLPAVREEAEEAPRRRCRPVFADQQQWMRGDARLERELKPWMERWRELVRKAGGDVWRAAGMVQANGR